MHHQRIYKHLEGIKHTAKYKAKHQLTDSLSFALN